MQRGIDKAEGCGGFSICVGSVVQKPPTKTKEWRASGWDHFFRDAHFPASGLVAVNIRKVVADQPASTAGEDRRQVGQACPVLLADAGAESHLTRRLFGSMVRRIDVLAVASG